MSKGFVFLGDKTTHGGQVLSASSTMIVNGKKVALIGDKVSCPKKGHGVNALLKVRLNGPQMVRRLLLMVAAVNVVVS